MARKISRGFRTEVILKFRRIFHDKADQAPIFFRVERFARYGSCVGGAVSSGRCNFSERSARKTKELRTIWAAQARVTVFFALSLAAVSSLTSGLKMWAPAFFICV